ncbi:MAG: DUF6526 family protein [Lutibacter sp.]|nr:DUF6526 family protein [Lutibacter sp.]
MKHQNYKNHGKYVFGYHVITLLAILAFLGGSIRNLWKASEDNLNSASLLVLLAFILFFMFYFIRSFALKAQDRAIRAEEKLRYFILTGKSISNNLTTRQFVGLRFESDDEFVAMADKAAMQNLSETDIKKAIVNWNADNYRV